MIIIFDAYGKMYTWNNDYDNDVEWRETGVGCERERVL